MKSFSANHRFLSFLTAGHTHTHTQTHTKMISFSQSNGIFSIRMRIPVNLLVIRYVWEMNENMWTCAKLTVNLIWIKSTKRTVKGNIVIFHCVLRVCCRRGKCKHRYLIFYCAWARNKRSRRYQFCWQWENPIRLCVESTSIDSTGALTFYRLFAVDCIVIIASHIQCVANNNRIELQSHCLYTISIVNDKSARATENDNW